MSKGLSWHHWHVLISISSMYEYIIYTPVCVYAKEIDTQSRSFALIKQFQEVKMWRHFVWMMLLSAILLPLTLFVRSSQSVVISNNQNDKVKSDVFLSPMFVLGPGSVINKDYYNIDFPRGHVAVKDFTAEVVDEMGNPVPLHETYMHHWLVGRYYSLHANESDLSEVVFVRNSGLCEHTLTQYFGLGSETRRTTTYVPGPYGIEIGNPKEIPDGYEERWLLNVHAIDTRGVVDRLGCTECRCDLYNITRDVDGEPLDPNYVGGLKCCHDQTQCRLKEGVSSFMRRSLYLRYTVKWVDWEDAIVPVKIYLLDITDDTTKKVNHSTSLNAPVGCKVEYEVEACGASGVASNGCIDSKKTSLVFPNGGYVIYGVAHQHTGGRGSALYGEDGRTICSSIPIYGQGTEPGNETDYIVGMSTCYPQPGSIKISNGETLLMVSNYSSTQKHTGVMGLFYLLVAEQPVKSSISSQLPVHYEKLEVFHYALVSMGIVLAFVVGVSVILLIYRGMKEKEKAGYQSLIDVIKP